MGYITIKIEKTYSVEQITAINKAIDDIYPSVVKPELSDRDNIKNVHDYIINNTKYDILKKTGNTPYNSDTAYGALSFTRFI